MPSREVRLEFDRPEHLPVFSNVAYVNTISGDVIIGFGFVDPVDLPSSDTDEVPTVNAKTIVRIAMSRGNAERLLKVLHDSLAKAEVIDDAGEPE